MTKLSVVVPTRERCATLPFALRTCLDQDYPDLEIVVVDNASADATASVVEDLADARLRYVRAERRLSMARNWELGLAHVTGDYVTFIGDDDGLLPGALSDVAALIERHDVEAVAWSKAEYGWPNHPDPSQANLLVVPRANRLFLCSAHSFARDCATFWTPYMRGPCLYNAFVSMGAIDRVRARSGGVFFHSPVPDVYSAIAIAAVIDRYLFSHRPFSVNGASGRSNGAGTETYLRLGHTAPSEPRTFLAEVDLPLHPSLPVLIVGSVVALVLESLLHANDQVYGGSLPISLERGIAKSLREVARASPERYASVVAGFAEAAQANPSLVRSLRRALQRFPNRSASAAATSLAGVPADSQVVDANRAGCDDVWAASRLTGALLGRYTPPSRLGRYSRAAKVLSRALRIASAAADPLLW